MRRAALVALMAAIVLVGGLVLSRPRDGSSTSASSPRQLTPPAVDPLSGGVPTVSSAVHVQQGETFLPAPGLVHPRLTFQQAFDHEEQHVHPDGRLATYPVPSGSQVRIGYLDLGRPRHQLVYALIDESSLCIYLRTPPKDPGSCPRWDFLSTSTGRYVAGGMQAS